MANGIVLAALGAGSILLATRLLRPRKTGMGAQAVADETLPAPHKERIAINPHFPWVVVHQGYTVLVTHPDGSLQEEREGLFDFDCRILSKYRLLLNDETPEYVAGGVLESELWVAHLRLPREGEDPESPCLPEDALEVYVTRRISRGMKEQIIIRNHSMAALETELAIELDADFADIQELEGERKQVGQQQTTWDAAARALVLDYHAHHEDRSLHRALRVRIQEADSDPHCTERTLQFKLHLPPRGIWKAVLYYDSFVDNEWREPLPEINSNGTKREQLRAEWRKERTHVESPHPIIEPASERAADDLFALRDWEWDEDPNAWFPMAGVPSYTGVFGRDSLTAAWQAAMIGPEMMRGALHRMAETQSDADSAWHDQEPDKMIHEIRRGPLADLNITPHKAYYGTHTTSTLFVITLSEYWHWTGDEALLYRYRDAALRTFDWIDNYGDRDGDGFLEYVQRSSGGLKNHAWKDSDEAIRYPDGTLVENPIATIEEQAYYFTALQRMAEVLLVLGEEKRAERFLSQARTLKRRWDKAFWVEEDQFYAMALDPEKKPVRSVGSNAGHGFLSGIIPPKHARTVADRLMAPDMFSGWGIRTLSSEHPSYNPLAYHLGTVWPMENASIAFGFKRYGLDEHADRLITALFAAIGYFRNQRLPETLGGHSQDESLIPTVYPRSNAPQAWSASATIHLVQAMLGIYPFAPARLLILIDPRLPRWLPELTLRHLRVGDAVISIRFKRQPDGTTLHEVTERDGRLTIVTVPPLDDVNPEDRQWQESVWEWVLEHAPGQTARALRIALGKEP